MAKNGPKYPIVITRTLRFGKKLYRPENAADSERLFAEMEAEGKLAEFLSTRPADWFHGDVGAVLGRLREAEAARGGSPVDGEGGDAPKAPEGPSGELPEPPLLAELAGWLAGIEDADLLARIRDADPRVGGKELYAARLAELAAPPAGE